MNLYSIVSYERKTPCRKASTAFFIMRLTVIVRHLHAGQRSFRTHGYDTAEYRSSAHGHRTVPENSKQKQFLFSLFPAEDLAPKGTKVIQKSWFHFAHRHSPPFVGFR